jgi:ribosomal protein L22
LSFWNIGRGDKGETSVKTPINPLTEEFLKRKPQNRATITRGSLSSSSIFEDEEQAGPKPKHMTGTKAGQKPDLRNPDIMAAALDPDPIGRKLWERRMVIRGIQKRGRLTRIQLLKRQERQLLSKSHDFQTSVKKLAPLARQIAGKTVDEAIIQMRFSKKKAAREVKEHLVHAKNEAIVKRGMGLGSLDVEKTTPIKIKTKDGKRVTVSDPTTLYVDQAWCGKGLFGKTPDYRARGQVNIMKNRTTSKFLFRDLDRFR